MVPGLTDSDTFWIECGKHFWISSEVTKSLLWSRSLSLSSIFYCSKYFVQFILLYRYQRIVFWLLSIMHWELMLNLFKTVVWILPLREMRRGMRKFLPQYKKVVYRAYTDKDFTLPDIRGELQEHLGIMGPFIRTEINGLLTVSVTVAKQK